MPYVALKCSIQLKLWSNLFRKKKLTQAEYDALIEAKEHSNE